MYTAAKEKSTARTKHIDLKINHILELIQKKVFVLHKIFTCRQPADILTKVQNREPLNRWIRILRLKDFSDAIVYKHSTCNQQLLWKGYCGNSGMVCIGCEVIRCGNVVGMKFNWEVCFPIQGGVDSTWTSWHEAGHRWFTCANPSIRQDIISNMVQQYCWCERHDMFVVMTWYQIWWSIHSWKIRPRRVDDGGESF